ncbi:MAG: heavy-metal-associated domain-containing protein [Rhodopirellula sp. JB053]
MSTTIKRKEFLLLATAMLVALFVSAPIFGTPRVHGEEKRPQTTTLTVGEMCSGCVKRITARFDKEESVSKIQCDIAAKTVLLVPAKDIRLSPRKIWEIMESIGKKPLKLVGPDGTFTSKPEKT